MSVISEFSTFLDGENWTPAVQMALSSGAKELIFPRGTYHFHRVGTQREYCFFSNNDEGIKYIVFGVENRTNFRIISDGADFIFHDRVMPFRFRNCCNLVISGVSIDFAEPFIIPAVVIGHCGSEVTLKLAPEASCFQENGKICFINDEFRFQQTSLSMVPIDPEQHELLADTRVCGGSCFGRIESSGILTICNATSIPPDGTRVMLKSEPRLVPGIVFDDCREVRVTHLNIYHAGGMGILAQNSSDLNMEHVTVDVRPGSGREISVPDDGFHFANCSGSIRIADCTLRHMLDDGINIHGFYRNYLFRENHFLQTGHFQQFGVDFARAGERLMFGDEPLEIRQIQRASKQLEYFTAAGHFPDSVCSGCKVWNCDRQPDVEIISCNIGSNRPRGVLVTSGGRVRIRYNVFHTPGAAIYIAGDDEFWYEAGPVRDVEIFRNTFDRCLYHGFCTGRAVIDIAPESANLKKKFYHQNIQILENDFIPVRGKILSAGYTDGLCFRGNRISGSIRTQTSDWFALEHCGQTDIAPLLPVENRTNNLL